MRFYLFPLSLILLSNVGCSSAAVLRDKDYRYSLNAFRSGDPVSALENFPKGEEGGFITSVEKSWLGLWDTPQPRRTEALAKQSRTFDDRKFTSVTREAGTFLVQESEEGYVPAEDEVVTLHLIAALAFMQLSRWEDAEVEARRASFYLQNQFNENQPHFDDPALRIWLAGVWLALGDWNAAQVDLRVAARLSKNERLAALASAASAPKELTVFFDGVSPALNWSDTGVAPEFADQSQRPARQISFNTLPWYTHHAERNSALRDVLLKSNYMSQYISLKTTNAFARGGGKTIAFLVGAAGVVVGLAIIGAGLYVAASATGPGSGELIGAIVGAGGYVAVAAIQQAKRIDYQIQSAVERDEKRVLENMRTYRLVRFLPAWVSVEASLAQNSKNLDISERERRFEIVRPNSDTRVRFTHRF